MSQAGAAVERERGSNNTARTVLSKRQRLLLFLVLAGLVVAAGPARGQDDLRDGGGPVMQAPTVFLIFWLPSGNHYDPSGAGGDTTYESVMGKFFADLTGTGYYHIMSQYPGECGPPNLGTNTQCFGGVTVGGTTLDTTPYPHSGKPGDELNDSDIRARVTAFIKGAGLTPGQNTEFFVFTGANINECAPFAGCTETDFCAYHADFQMGGSTVMYGYMPNLNSLDGCNEGISKGPNLLSVDREIIATSHEFAESLTDPQDLDNRAWDQVITGSEIGDVCNPEGTPFLGTVASDGSNVTFGSDKFVVQQEWSNNDGACVLSSGKVTGPTIEFTTNTGSDDLRSNSTLNGALQAPGASTFQTSTLHPQDQTLWDNHSTHVRVFGATPPSAGMADTNLTLTSHNGFGQNNDQWAVQFMDVKLRNPNGTLVCDQSGSGNPLAKITDGSPFAFATPSCVPPPTPGFDRVEIVIQTGNDDAGSGDEITAWFSGQPVVATLGGQKASLCLKPRTNVGGDGVCPNGSGATDQQGKDTWDNWHTSDQVFALAAPPTSASGFGTITITLVQNSCGPGCDNWDIQGIMITAFNSNGLLPRTTLLNMSKSQNGDNCLARLKTGQNPNNVTWNLSATDPTGINVSSPNPVFGPTPPGLCPQGNFPYL